MAKDRKKRRIKNLRIPTRLTLSTIGAIALPLVLVIVFSSVFLNTMASYFNFSAVTTDSYSMVNQIQWSQTVGEIGNELISDDTLAEKQSRIKEFVSPLEKLGSVIYIGCNGEPIYATTDVQQTKELANSIVKIDTNINMNHFSENGIVIVSHSTKDNEEYLVIIANNDYTVNDVTSRYNAQDFTSLVSGKTGLILFIIVAIFVLSILILSLITSQTISKPLELLANGANEIASGNLEHKINYESKNEIGTTVAAFNDMTAQLKSAVDDRNRIDESRKEMIAGVAHDLRTPLTSVKGYVEGLRDGIASTDEMRTQYLQTIYSSTEDMERLLDDLLSFSRLELGRIQIECYDVDINSFLAEYCEELEYPIKQKNFDLTYTNPYDDHKIMVRLDADRFVRVLSNIISNSIKYARKDVRGRIDISLQEYEKSIIISIADNGIGVEDENLGKIFDSFFRADQARTRVNEGSGIGLAVCKQIVDMHGGRIWATSQYGIGTTIHISLDKMEDKNG